MPFIDLDEFKMHYRIVGSGDPLLLVHGLGGDSTSWEFVEPHLSKNYMLLIPELRCHGLSGCPEGMHTPENFAEDIHKFVEALEIEKPPVMGTSLGGMVVQQLILDYPDTFSAAILMDTTPQVDEHLVDLVYAWREAQIEGGEEAYWWTATQDTVSPEYIKNNPERMEYLKTKFLSNENETDVLSVLGFATFDVLERLPSIEIPVFIIHGELDRLMPPERGKLIHQRVPNSKFEMVHGCAHSPDLETPELLATLVSDFLSDVL